MNFLNFELKTLVPQGFQKGGGGEVGVFLRRKLEEFFQKMLPVPLFQHKVSQKFRLFDGIS